MGRYEESVDQFASARMLFGRSIGADSPLYGSACASWPWLRREGNPYVGDKGSDLFLFFSGGLTCALAKCAMVNSWILKPYWGSSIHEVRDLLAQRVWIPIRDDHKPWHKWCERDKLYDQLFENWMSKAICGLCVETDCMFTTWVKHFVRLGVYIVYDNVKDLFKGCSLWSSSESTGKARKSLLQRILIEVWLWPSSCVGSH